jgi:D-inositol-3-phosphate glycosyltransferase
VEAALMAEADAIVAATEVDRRHMVELYGADAGRIEIIPPGVDLDLFRPIPPAEARVRLGQAPDHRMILFVGRMDPVKGLDTLVRAMALVMETHPDMRENACLCIVGGDRTDDPARMDAEMARVARLGAELGMGDFLSFLGPQAQEDLRDYYSAAQVVVVPSRYESFGMVALEAMACGTPVIASDVGGLSTLVRHGRTGFLVPDRDAEALAAALRCLLDNPHLRAELGEHGVATAEAYGWPVIAGDVEALYERLLASGQRGEEAMPTAASRSPMMESVWPSA